jgi:hypothetical protein
MFDPDVGGEDLVLQILYTHTHTHSDKKKGEKDLTAVGRTTPKIYTTTTKNKKKIARLYTLNYFPIYLSSTNKEEKKRFPLFIYSIDIVNILKALAETSLYSEKEGGFF